MPVVVLKAPPVGLPQRMEVGDKCRIGGEAAVYFTLDGKYAIKVYHEPRPDKESLLAHVMLLFRNQPADQQRFILPPLALIESVDGVRRVGFVMRRVDPHYRELLDFMLNPVVAVQWFKQGKTWADYLKVARSIANAIVVLHGKGCAHSDIHFRNFLASLDDGEAVMLDIDGVVVQGWLPPQVKGLLGFMAPEILTHGEKPSERTDRYSLAILVLHTLLLRNPMQPLTEYDSDQKRSDELGFGQYALFSEDPRDRRNRPRNVGVPLYQRGALSYRTLTLALQKLTERALIQGLHNPDLRPNSREWLEALACAVDELWMCTRCKQYFVYPYWLRETPRRRCPFCGTPCAPPLPAVLELLEERSRGRFEAIGRHLVLGHGFKLFADAVEPRCIPPATRRGKPAIGEVIWEARAGSYRLTNVGDFPWRVISGGIAGGGGKIGRGQSIPLSSGLVLSFGEGKRIARVLE